MTKAELTELISEIERFPVGEIDAKVEHLISRGVTVDELTPTQQKIKWLDSINGTNTVVTYEGNEYTVTGLMKKRIGNSRVISVELTPLNKANSLTYVRVQDVKRREHDR